MHNVHGIWPLEAALVASRLCAVDPISRPEGATPHLRKQAAAEVAKGVRVLPDPFDTAQCDSGDQQRPRHVESRARQQHQIGRVARWSRIKTRQACRAVGRKREPGREADRPGARPPEFASKQQNTAQMHMLTYRVLCQVMELRSQMLVSAGSLKRDEGALLLDHIESILRHQRQLQDSTQQVMAAELGICFRICKLTFHAALV